MEWQTQSIPFRIYCFLIMIHVIPLDKPCQSFLTFVDASWQGLEVECFILEVGSGAYVATPSSVVIGQNRRWIAIDFGPLREEAPSCIILEGNCSSVEMVLRKVVWMSVYPDALNSTHLQASPFVGQFVFPVRLPVLAVVIAFYECKHARAFSVGRAQTDYHLPEEAPKPSVGMCKPSGHPGLTLLVTNLSARQANACNEDVQILLEFAIYWEAQLGEPDHPTKWIEVNRESVWGTAQSVQRAHAVLSRALKAGIGKDIPRTLLESRALLVRLLRALRHAVSSHNWGAKCLHQRGAQQRLLFQKCWE